MQFIKQGKPHNYILSIIVLAQFACTSTWFAVNAVLQNLTPDFAITENELATVVSIVQAGFISGTLVFAFLNITDRFSPSKVFFVNALLAAVAGIGIICLPHKFINLLLLRFFTGFFLAGIYPVGMKIAADYFEKGLGKALGFLVGALVLGTAFPHLLQSLDLNLSWQWVIGFTSILSLSGGLIILLFVPDGPFRKKSSGVDFSAFKKIFVDKKFKGAAFGYFGHMWELYTFWAFVPLIIKTYTAPNGELSNTALFSFLIIAIGAIACIVGGFISIKKGSLFTAKVALTFSLLCCLLSPLIFYLPSFIFLIILLFWGFTVIADSPQFSTLVAFYAPAQLKGSALTLVNSIGFFITIISIQLMSFLLKYIQPQHAFTVLAVGPIVGLIAMRKNLK